MGVSPWKGARLPVHSTSREERQAPSTCVVHSAGSTSENHEGRVGEGQEEMGGGGFVEWSKGAVGHPGHGQGLQGRVGILLRGWEAGHGENSHFLTTLLGEGWLLYCHPQRVSW